MIWPRPAGSPAPGAGALTVGVVAGASALTSLAAASPLKILVPRPRGPSVWAYLSSFGGGLVAGDETRVDVTLEPGARCFLGTQAATKVYRNPAGRPCGHRLDATLGAGSLLVLAPDPVQAFAGSRYHQRQTFELGPGSGLVLVDWLSAGRTARGERWAFDHFESRNEVRCGAECRLLDAVRLDALGGPLTGAHRLGRFNCLAMLALLGEPLAAATTNLLAETAARPVRRREPLLVTASPLPHGVIVRLAGESLAAVAAEIQRLLAFVPVLLHDDPWRRKW